MNIIVINDSNFDNNSRKFEVENWDDFANQLCEKLRDQNGNPINDSEKNSIRSNKNLTLKDGITIKVSDIIDLSSGNYLSSTTPNLLEINSSFINNALSTVTSVITGQNSSIASAMIGGKVAGGRQGRFYKW